MVGIRLITLGDCCLANHQASAPDNKSLLSLVWCGHTSCLLFSLLWSPAILLAHVTYLCMVEGRFIDDCREVKQRTWQAGMVWRSCVVSVVLGTSHRMPHTGVPTLLHVRKSSTSESRWAGPCRAVVVDIGNGTVLPCGLRPMSPIMAGCSFPQAIRLWYIILTLSRQKIKVS